jgi:hypothetical protein
MNIFLGLHESRNLPLFDAVAVHPWIDRYMDALTWAADAQPPQGYLCVEVEIMHDATLPLGTMELRRGGETVMEVQLKRKEWGRT